MTRSVVRGSWNEQGTAVAAASWVITVLYDGALGVLFLVGGAQRISNPSYSTLRDFGGHVPTGVAFVAAAVLIAIAAAGSGRTLAAALIVGCVLNLLLAAGFWAAVVTEPPPPPLDPHFPRASLIGPVPFLFVGAVHLIRARFYWRLEPGKS